MTGSYSMQSIVARPIVARPTHGPYVKSRTLKLKSRVNTIKFNRNGPKFFEMTQYNWQLLCAKQYGKIYIIFFLRNEFLLSCNHSLANSYYIMSSNIWVGLVCGGGSLGWSGLI